MSEKKEDTPMNLYPEPGELADEFDGLDWCRERDGRMRDFAAPDDAVKTVPYEGD